ncbi:MULTISPECIES: GntP family permease [unclassified Duganella]|uniref:GntP family permease n=1 Tax=unclassified Duganella TaxID=2636909 RepID=UPI00088F2E05|nr:MULTISPECIES: GntP family permease [unclassified Duganella]SDH14479.1 H+/gluconate symporter [Duganella sp. OV458]SDK29024.1 H+/gluconate symporter [Duganella sp. OV510]
MSFLIVLAALVFLMLAAYRGYSVILFAPIAALGAVLLTDPGAVAPVFSGIFMDKMVGFIKLYFPVFLLGAVFGKLIELSGFSEAIVVAAIKYIGRSRANAVIVLVCALLTYGGVSLFVVVFAVYPFAAELYRQSNIPKRLMPGAIALGAFSFTMDTLPGTPQIQNIIPTTFFKTTGWAAPYLGVIGSIATLAAGLAFLEWRRRSVMAKGEGYEATPAGAAPAATAPAATATATAKAAAAATPATPARAGLPHPLLSLAPLVMVGVANFALTKLIPGWYGDSYALTADALPGLHAPVNMTIKPVIGIWAVEGALLLGILLTVVTAFGRIKNAFAEGTKAAVGGALLAAMNTASEYGFGGVIAALPGFLSVSNALRSVPDPLVNAAVSVTSLAGITGSASGGMSIALAAMSDQFIKAAEAANIPLEVMHRVVAMASGGMDTLPHNGAVITLLAVTGLTHRQSYRDIFGVTVIKTLAVFFVIAVYYLTGLV